MLNINGCEMTALVDASLCITAMVHTLEGKGVDIVANGANFSELMSYVSSHLSSNFSKPTRIRFSFRWTILPGIQAPCRSQASSWSPIVIDSQGLPSSKGFTYFPIASASAIVDQYSNAYTTQLSPRPKLYRLSWGFVKVNSIIPPRTAANTNERWGSYSNLSSISWSSSSFANFEIDTLIRVYTGESDLLTIIVSFIFVLISSGSYKYV